MINVTKTYLPPLTEYQKYLKKIWKNGWVTNNGPLVQELEQRLKDTLGVNHVFFTSNGTIALQIAMKALEIKKEVITTPFSYVATTTSILWENYKPIFVDIDKDTCCINSELIEKKITPHTQAILATHVYGIPCDIEKIEAIAKRNKLKVIYDAAHAFGSHYKNKPLATYGDISTLSFHATKLFHTVEGGAIVTNDDSIARKIRLYRSFGHIKDDYFSIGINGKNSEIHAAMGLCLLDKVPLFIKQRKKLHKEYDQELKGLNILRPSVPPNTKYNYSYYPIVLKSESQLLKIKQALENNKIFPRRYFYPSLNKLPYLKGEECPISESYASRVLCLPMFNGLKISDLNKTTKILRSTLIN